MDDNSATAKEFPMKKFFNKLMVLLVFLTGGYQTIGHMWTVSGSANVEPAGTGVARIELRFTPPGSTPAPQEAKGEPKPALPQVIAPVHVVPIPDSVPPVSASQKSPSSTPEVTLTKGTWKASFSAPLPQAQPEASRSGKWLDRTLRTVGFRK
jgi:hypothetical protein